MPEFSMPLPTAPVNPTATSLDRSEESTTTALYRAAIGSVNLDYYLPLFTRFEERGRAGLSWNGAASLYTLNWMIFRQLRKAALAYVAVLAGALLLVFGIARLLFQFSETVEIGLGLALASLSFVVPGFYGNALLYNACRKKMAQALSASKTWPEACALLNQQASSRTRFIVVALTNGALAGVALAAWLLLPASAAPPLSQQKSGEIRTLAADPTLPVLPATPAASATAPAMAPPASTPQLLAVPAPPASSPVAASRPPVTVACADCQRPTGAASEPATEKHFYINVGLFASTDNAHNARRKLRMAGLPATAEALQTKKGPRTRIRVGPFNTQSETEAAVQKIHRLELEAIAFQQ